MSTNRTSEGATSPTKNHASLDQADLILRSIREAVIMTDLSGVVTYWNDAATRMFGWTAEEMLGRPHTERFPVERRAWLEAQMAELATGLEWDDEFEDVRKDGSPIWIRAHVRKILGPDGQPAGILGISQDISAQKEAQRGMRAQEILERAVLNSMAAHIAVLDRQGNIRAVNRAWQRFSEDNVGPVNALVGSGGIGSNYLQVCRSAGEDADSRRAEQGILEVLSGRRAEFGMEYACHCGSRRRWFRMTVTPLSDPAGGVAGGAVVAHSDITERMLSEEHSRLQSERLQLALEAAHMGVWSVDVASSTLDVSPEVTQILQRASMPADLARLHELVHPQDAAVMDEKLARCIVERGRFEGSFRILRSDGAVRWLHNFAQVQVSPAGDPQRVVGTVQDITTARVGRLAMRRQNAILQQIVQGAPLPRVLADIARLVEEILPGTLCSILLHDRGRNVLRTGAAPSIAAEYNAKVDGLTIGPQNGACGSAAYHRHGVLVRDIGQDPLFADYRNLALSHGLHACLSLPILSGDKRRSESDRLLGTFALYRRSAQDPDGSFATFAAASELVVPNSDFTTQEVGELAFSDELESQSIDGRKALANAVFLTGLAIERQQTLQELKSNEERFRLLFNGISDYALLLVESPLRIRTWNAGAQRIFGYTESEAIGMHAEELYTPEERAMGLLQQRMRTMHAQGRVEFEGWRRRKDGSQFWASTVASVLHEEDGSVRGIAVIIRDLTEKRRLDEQLRQSQKMDAIGRLAGGVAHDFNNLLMIINGYSELLMTHLADDPELAETVSAIRDAGERAATLTGQLLAFSRKALVEPKLLDLNAVVGAAGRMLQRLLGEDIQLSTQLAPQLGRIRLDPGQLDQILLNLAANARDAMPTGGTLQIQTSAVEIDGSRSAEFGPLRPGQYAQLLIRDSGAGMPDDVRQHLFEPFYTTKQTGSGTGLGLAMVYGIVQQAGGGIHVESAPGRGTQFRIVFPLAAVRPQSSPPVQHSVPRGSETILVVEDEDAVRQIVCLSLQALGYRVMSAGSARAALEIATTHAGPIHVLLTDVVMPDVGGRTLAEQLLKLRPQTRVLYMSGYTDDAVVRHGIEAATVAFLQKPFTPLSLASKLRELLDS